MGYGKTRFASPADSFKLLYTAADLATAIAETIVRDRFERAAGRTLNITGAKAQKESRVFSQVLYVTTDLDGILSSARLRKQNCIATYQRAVPAHLTARAAVPVETLAHLVPALRRLKIKLNR